MKSYKQKQVSGIVRIINIHMFLTLMCDVEYYCMSVICHLPIFRASNKRLRLALTNGPE
jgi:hypothetical protein